MLLLRFVRGTKAWIGLPIALVCLAGTSLIADQGMLPIPGRIAVIVTVISSAYALLPYALDRLFAPSLPVPVRTLLFPAAAVAEQVLLSGGGTWDNMAYGVGNIYTLQLASILGLRGIVFLIYWTAAVLNEIWEHRDRPTAVRGLAAVYIAAMLAVYGFGVWRLDRPVPAERTMPVAGIVPAPGHREALMQAFSGMASLGGGAEAERIQALMAETFDDLLAESNRQAAAGARLVLWSEGAVAVSESDVESYIERASALARARGILMGLGIVVLKDGGPASGEPFIENKLVLISPSGDVAWEYMKANLAPGMERRWTIRGDGRLKRFVSAEGVIAGVICYDMDFPAYIRQAGMMGTDLLLAPANDWLEIKETHWRMSRMRAIENGVSILRPSSSGISTAIDQFGRVVARVDYFQSGGSPLMAVLPVGAAGTLYTRVGDRWAWVCVAGAALLVVVAGIRWWRGRRIASL